MQLARRKGKNRLPPPTQHVHKAFGLDADDMGSLPPVKKTAKPIARPANAFGLAPADLEPPIALAEDAEE